jgi:hypothetical protein
MFKRSNICDTIQVDLVEQVDPFSKNLPAAFRIPAELKAGLHRLPVNSFANARGGRFGLLSPI